MKSNLLALSWQRLDRIVVLVDVQVFAQGNVHASQAYAALIHSCIERTLEVCNDLNTGHKRTTSWSYKLFDSSLSPIASSSTLQKLLKDRPGGQNQIGRFKSAEENLGLFRQTLSVVATEINSKYNPRHPTQSKADFVVRALQELLTDFNWSTVFISDGSSDEDEARRRRGESLGGTPPTTQNNLVMVFSHFPENMEKLASFLNMPTSQDAVGGRELFKAFSLKMKKVREPFRLQGIRGCWIDMPRVSTSLTSPLKGPPVSSGTDRILQRSELCAVFAQTKWKYTTMDALAIASDCIPPPMLWFSVVQPDLQVQPNAQKMQCKLRVSVLGRDGAPLQPDICRLEAVSIGSNGIDNALMKESVSAILKLGSLSSKAERLPLVKRPLLESPVIRIVVKSLIPKQDVAFKCTLRCLLSRRLECRADSKKMNSIALAENGEPKPDPLADDASSDISEHDILQQLHQEPTSFEAGDRAWQVLLISIARKNSVAEVDLYIDGDCSSAILEPITPQYAAVLQKDQASKPVSPDCNKPLLVQGNGPKLLLAPPQLQPIVTREGTDLVHSECVPSKLEMRPGKRPASAIPEVDGPLMKRGKAEFGSEQRPTSSEQIKHTKREAYSWFQHWRYILHRKTIGTGQVHIENRYMRPESGRKPLKAISIIKCWLDLMSKRKPVTAQQIVPFIPAVPGPAELDREERMVEGRLNHTVSAEKVGEADKSIERVGEADKSIERVGEADKSTERVGETDKSIERVGEADKSTERVGEADKSIVRVGETDKTIGPLRGKCLLTAILDTKEQAESYLSSIEQMLQECLESDAGDLQVFVKGILSNATKAHRILSKRKKNLDLVHPSGENKQCPTKEDSVQVHCKGERNIERRETVEPCNSDSSCASNVSKGEKVDHHNDVKLAMNQETLDSVSGVGNIMEYGGSSDGADSGIKTNEAILSEKVAGQLMDKLLVKPKKLARHYSTCDSATPDFVHIRQEKLRSYELQVLFRMELIERDCGGPLEKSKTKIVKEICKLLDDIQFDLGGGVFSGESLHDYSIRVIHNRYKKRLPQTVADIFERMEFNGYVDGESEAPPAPASPHAPADLVRSHVQKETEGEEIPGNCTTMEAAARLVVSIVQPMEKSGQNDAFPTSKKGQCKRRRKRSVPVDAFTRAIEKRKLASSLTHFGGPDSLQRLKKLRIHHQSPKSSKAISPAMGKPQTKDQNTVLETPRFERPTARAGSSNLLDEDNEVDSTCTRVLPSVFGFGTPARVSKHMPTTRKRRQALFKEKKPPGRGLPRISQDVMKAMAEGSNFQEQASPNPEGEREPSADILKDARTTCNSTILTEMIAGEFGDHGRLEKNATQVLPHPAAEMGATQETVQKSELSNLDENPHPADLTSLENRWDDEIIPCTLPTELPMRVSEFGNAQRNLVETERIEMLGDSVLNGGLLNILQCEERASRSSPKASFGNPVDLSSETEVLIETQTVEALHSQKHRIGSPQRALSEDALSLSTSDFPITPWEMPCMDLNGTQDFEQEVKVGISQMVPTTDKPASPGSCTLHTAMPCMDLNATQDHEQEDWVEISQMVPTTDKPSSPGNRTLHTVMPVRINQTSKVCRVDPPSLPWLNRRAAEDKAPLVKSSGFIEEDEDFSQLIQDIFQQTQMMEQSRDAGCHGLKLDDAGNYLDDFSLLRDENWSPQPRLKPEARLSAIFEEDAVVAVGSPIKFMSPSPSRKCRRTTEGSPAQYLCSPNAAMHSKKRTRSNSTSPNPTKIKMLRFV